MFNEAFVSDNSLGTNDDHMAVLAMAGIFPAKPEPPDCPHEVEHILNWFYQLNRQRPPAFSGVAAIPYTAIEAWASIKGIRLTWLERSLIELLDHTFCRVASEAIKSKSKKTN